MMALYTWDETCCQTSKYKRIVVICGYYPQFCTITSSVFLCWTCGTALHANPWRIQHKYCVSRGTIFSGNWLHVSTGNNTVRDMQ